MEKVITVFKKAFGFLIIFLMTLLTAHGQGTDEDKYKSMVKQAIDLYKNKEFKTAGITFEEAFRIYGPEKMDLYYAARCWALSGKKRKAFKYLSEAVEKKFTNYNHLTSNPDFAFLYLDKRWSNITKKVKENKEFIEAKFAPISQSLRTVILNDQKYRLMLDSVQQKFGWQSAEFRNLNKKIHESDSANLKLVTSIIDNYGWLGEEEIGGEGADAIFLVIQHADLKTQEKYLPIMRTAVKSGKVVPQYLAILEDRVLVRKGKKQIYGSQVTTDQNTRKRIFSPIEDEPNVNKRRATVGLPPLEEYAKRMGIEYEEALSKE